MLRSIMTQGLSSKTDSASATPKRVLTPIGAMPEGPEVRTTVDRLSAISVGRRIASIDFVNDKYRSKQVRDQVDELVAALPLTIESVNCKGKFIWFELSDGWTIWNTLGMAGSWRTEPGRHHMLTFVLDDHTHLAYNDSRRFGTFKMFHDPDASLLEAKLAKLGPDLLADPGIDAALWRSRLRARDHRNVCEALMDQKVVSGIGNYLKAEALYRARIHPLARVGDLTDDDLESLRITATDCIRRSYAAKGATLRDYRLPDGTAGQATFEFQCYNRNYDPHGNTVIAQSTPDKRTTHWVPNVQVVGAPSEQRALF